MNRNSKFEGFPKVLVHKQNKIQKNNIFVIFMFDSRGRTAYNPQTVAARWRICPNLQGDVDNDIETDLGALFDNVGI